MATTAWGSGLSADELLTYSGHVELSATRLASSALLLDWVRFSGNPRHYWTFDEGAGTIAHDTGSGTSTDFTLNAAVWETANPWIGPADYNPTNHFATAVFSPEDVYQMSAGVTFECWAYCRTDGGEHCLMYQAGYDPYIIMNRDGVGCMSVTFGGRDFRSALGAVSAGWHHLAFTFNASTSEIWCDGQKIALYSGNPRPTGQLKTLYLAYRTQNWTRPWGAQIGDLAIHGTKKYTEAFSPHRYEQGYTVLTKTAEAAARRVTGVDWTGTFGADSGSVYRVQVNTGTDVSPAWVTVGGDNPTSPVTGLDLTVQAGVTRWVRAYLNPKADALQSATPILTAMRVTHEAVGGAPRIYAPQRFGPSLIPLGGLL